MNKTNTEELIGKSTALFEQAKAILSNAESTAEDKATVPAMLEDARRLKGEAAQMKEIEAELYAAKSFARSEPNPNPPTPMQPERKLRHWLLDVVRAGDTRYRGPVNQELKKLTEDADPEWDGKMGAPGFAEDKATMTSAVGARGGFLVPPEFLNQLYGVEQMATPIAFRATRLPMRRRTLSVPVIDQTGTTAGQAHWFGGIQAYWTAEGGLKTQSEPTFRQVTLTARKLVCYSRTTDELLDDSAIGLEAFLSGDMGFAGAIRWYTEYAFLRGTGAGQPLGILNSGATITENADASPSTAASIYADLVAMMASFLPGASGVWFINQGHMAELLTMNGPSGSASYLWGNAVSGAPNTLLGYPVVWTEKLPAPGTAGSILLADPKYYLIGERQATTIESTNVERFQYDETSWRAVHRVDGQPWLSAPLTLADGTSTVSPFVILGTKST